MDNEIIDSEETSRTIAIMAAILFKDAFSAADAVGRAILICREVDKLVANDNPRLLVD